MPLDRSSRHEEALRNLSIRHVPGGQLGHTPLARGQGLQAGEDDTTRPCPRRAQLGLGPLGERLRAQPVCAVERAAEDVARLGAPVRATEKRSQLGERAGVVELDSGLLVRRDGLAQEPFTS